MALPFYNWSKTAASNATADSTVNWAEGMAPSAVNDSARAMMASTAAFRDDISGAIATGGTSTAYTVTSYQVFDTLAHLNGQVVAFTPHTTNGATVTLNVDGLGAKPLRSAPSVELPAGTLVQGTPYTCLYNSSDAVFYLHNFFSNPYSIPIAGGVDYWGATAPNSAFAFPYGQAISRTTYSVLFALLGTTHGVGDGSTTFNLPDKRGRVSAGKDDMGGSAASRLTNAIMSPNGTTLGATGGAQTVTLSQAQLPNVNLSSASLSASTSLTNNTSIHRGTPTGFNAGAGGTAVIRVVDASYDTMTASTTISGTVPLGGSDSAHSNTQPTIICNYIMRII